MNRDCQEGLRLRKRFEKALKEWGWFDACERAVEIMPVGLPTIHELKKKVMNAESALFKARFAYAEHTAYCVVCSRSLITPDAIEIIDEKLQAVSENLQGL